MIVLIVSKYYHINCETNHKYMIRSYFVLECFRAVLPGLD